MIDTNSTTFKGTEKLGLFIGKVIRLAVLAGVAVMVSRYLNRTKLPLPPSQNVIP